MPTDYPRPPVQRFEGDHINFELDTRLTRDLRQRVLDTGTTLYMMLLAVYNVLLSRYSGQEDIVVGTPEAGRDHADFKNIVGLFINVLAMRHFPRRKQGFNAFLTDVKENILTVYENRGYPFGDLIDKINVRKDLSRNPLYDVELIVQNIDMPVLETGSLKFIPYERESKMTQVDMALTAVESGESIVFALRYCTRLFKRETMNRLAGHFVNILGEVVKDPGIRLSAIAVIGEEEKKQLVEAFNDTVVEFTADQAVDVLFEIQAARTPDNVALQYREKQVTYNEMNRRANRLAKGLKARNVGADTIVGVMAGRSLELLLSAGAHRLHIERQ
jgi:fengycin family lipopeptide synthetase D